MEVAEQFEATDASARGLAGTSTSANGSVHGVKSSGPVSMPKGKRGATCTCYRCGYDVHKASDAKCPACGKNCEKCGREGHFAKRCQTKSTKTKPTNQIRDNSQTSTSAATANSSESYCIGHVGERKCDAIFVNVNMCDQPLKMEVDTGAKVSVIPASIFSADAKWNGLILNKSEMQLSTYNATCLRGS